MARIVWADSVEQAGQTFDLVARYRRVWTCRVHDRPHVEYDEYGDEIEWNWPVPGCTCDTTARWEETDDIEFVLEGVLSKFLRAFYVPSIMEQLNNEVLFTKLMESR